MGRLLRQVPNAISIFLCLKNRENYTIRRENNITENLNNIIWYLKWYLSTLWVSFIAICLFAIFFLGVNENYLLLCIQIGLKSLQWHTFETIFFYLSLPSLLPLVIFPWWNFLLFMRLWSITCHLFVSDKWSQSKWKIKILQLSITWSPTNTCPI